MDTESRERAPDGVPDLYELAFMPGQFRCPKCGFQWSIQTMCVATGRIGTTEENRQTPDCPNDGTRMVNVTYREQLEAYAKRLKEELDASDRAAHETERLRAALAELRGLFSGDPGGEYSIARKDGQFLGLSDQMIIGNVMERVDAALAGDAKGEPSAPEPSGPPRGE